MKRIWGIMAAGALAGCSSGARMPGHVDVARAELREAPPLTAAVRPLAGDLVAASINFVRQQRADLGLTSDDDFKLMRQKLLPNGRDYERLQQYHAGIKVFGGEIWVHNEGEQVLGISGNLLRDIQKLDLTPAVDLNTAVGVAKSDYAGKALRPDPLQYEEEQRELVILPLEDGTARLAWHVSFFTEAQGGMYPGRWNYFIDAHDGSIALRFNAIDTVAKASGPGGNTKVKRTWDKYLDVTQSGNNYTMNTDQYETKSQRTGQDYTGTSLDNFNSDEPEANDAHGFAQVTIHMLKDWFDHNSIDEQGFKLLSILHVPDPKTGGSMANAFWDGRKMSYGDGGNTFYEMSGSLDVVAHEIDHGFTSFHSNLTYSGQSGGMNESFSDVAGTAAKFYYDETFKTDRADFDLGGDVIPPGSKLGTALRYMCDPPKDGGSIDNAANYNSSMDVHYTSGVMNKAFCRAAKRFSGVDPDTGKATPAGVHRAANAWFVANAQYWTASATYKQGCQGVIDAATKDLMYSPGEISMLGDSWKDVGVTCTYTHVDNDFTISMTPDKQEAQAGTTAKFQITTAVAPGSSTKQTLALKVDGLSGGITGDISPASIQSGESAELTITLPTDAPQGDLTVTVTATGDGSKDATAVLTVTAPPPPPDMSEPGPGNGTDGGTGGNPPSGPNGPGPSNGPGTGHWENACSMGPNGSSPAGLLLLAFAFLGVQLFRRRARS